MALERDKVTLSVTSPENGTAAEEVPGDYAAEGFEIGFNARYLLDIRSVEGDLSKVHLADAAAPPAPRNDRRPRSMSDAERCDGMGQAPCGTGASTLC